MEKGQPPPPAVQIAVISPPYPAVPAEQTPGLYPYPSQPAQQPVYQYSAQQPQVVQPVNQPVVVQKLPTDTPGQMTCPSCRNTVVTTMEYKSGLLTWLICGILALLIFWPCCWIPFCLDATKDIEHVCPVCHYVLRVNKRI